MKSNANKQTNIGHSLTPQESGSNTVTLIVLDQQDVEKAPNVSDMTLGTLKYLSIKPRFVADWQEVE